MAAGELVFGDIRLPGEVAGVAFDVLGPGSGTSWGTAEDIIDIVESFLQDGATEATTRRGNRELPLRLRLTATDSGALAAAEAALVAECTACDPVDGVNTLTWTPPDGFGPPSVFDIVGAHLAHDLADSEISYGKTVLRRYYSLTLRGLPFSRSVFATELTVPAPPATVTTVVIDDCAYVDNAAVAALWSASPADADAERYNADSVWLDHVNLGPAVLTFTRHSLSEALAGTPYVRITVTAFGSVLNGSGSVPAALTFGLNGTAATVLATSGDTVWLDGSAITTLNTISMTGIQPGDDGGIIVDEIARTNSLTGGTTGRENARQIPVAGSTRSPASLSLYDAAAALGTVLVYTTSDLNAHQPPLRTWLIPGPTVTIDSDLVSGASSPLSTDHVFHIPTGGVTPGGYILLARLISPSVEDDYAIAWEAHTVFGSWTDEGQSGSRTVHLDNTWDVVVIATMDLPPTRTGVNSHIDITLSGPAGVDLDEAWLFNLETGRLTWVECGDGPSLVDGTSSSQLWLDTASVDTPVPSIWRAGSTARENAIHAGDRTQSWGAHEFVPPAVSVFTVTTNSTDAVLTLSHYPRWHTHAGA